MVRHTLKILQQMLCQSPILTQNLAAKSDFGAISTKGLKIDLFWSIRNHFIPQNSCDSLARHFRRSHISRFLLRYGYLRIQKFENFSLKIWKCFVLSYFLIQTRFSIIYKKLCKNGITCLMTTDFDVLNVSGRKFGIRYRQNCLI